MGLVIIAFFTGIFFLVCLIVGAIYWFGDKGKEF